MKERNGLKVMLGIVGLLAWMAYILACRASWSPDSSKVLFSYYNPEADEAGVALYDRNTGETRSIFVRSDASSSRDGELILVQWESDGARAIAWVEKDELLLLPIESEKPARHFTLPGEVEFSPIPIPEVAGNLYFGGKGVFRLDLETGEVKAQESEKQRRSALIGRNGGVLYAREMAEPEEDSEEGEGSEGGGYEIGELDPDALTFQPLFELRKEELEANGMEDASFWTMAFKPDGSLIAPTGGGQERDAVIFCTREGLQKVVAPELPAEQYRLGNLQWSPDGKTLYASVMTPTDKEDILQFSLGEIPAEGGPARLVPIVRLQGDISDKEDIPRPQIALSPDGAMIAAATALFEEKVIPIENRALYLVDVQDPERKVTKVPLPPPQKSSASDEEE